MTHQHTLIWTERLHILSKTLKDRKKVSVSVDLKLKRYLATEFRLINGV